jgi:hypothetical protein
MVQTLRKQDSATRVVRSIRRHQRLLRRLGMSNVSEYAQRLDAPRAALESAMAAQRDAREAQEDAFDDWEQEDAGLDLTVHSVHRHAVDWDATHIGANTVALLFAGRAPSEITSSPRHAEPDLVARIVERGKSLPEGHPASSLLATLNERAEASRRAHRAWIDAGQKLAMADAALEVARITAVRAYRDNAIDLERLGGSTVVRRCFPTLRPTRTRTQDDEDADTSSDE